jgi:hypothetical protein
MLSNFTAPFFVAPVVMVEACLDSTMVEVLGLDSAIEADSDYVMVEMGLDSANLSTDKLVLVPESFV